MSIYEQNLEQLEKTRPVLYEKLQEPMEDTLQVMVGDALNGEPFLAVIQQDAIIPLSSTYHPSYEAEQFTAQFEEQWTDTTVLIFGMGQIDIIERILSEECPVDKCVVYEPSPMIFQKILETYDVQKLLANLNLMVIVEGMNDDLLEQVLLTSVDFRNYRFFHFYSLSKYKELFRDSYNAVQKVYKRVWGKQQVDMNTLVHFGQASLKNDIKSMKWLMRGKAFENFKGQFPKELPYIMVAAGPSLEKNVHVLKQAKGKAFIVCVDTALRFLLKHGIVPDMTCTIDPQKGSSYFEGIDMREIPMAVSTDSDYRSLEAAGDFQPIYVSVSNDFTSSLLKDQGIEMESFDGGGSVGTFCFQMGAELGFQTIIIIGQDLAFTDRKAHAGMGKAEDSDLIYGVTMVDGYDGGKIMTRGDFKNYIDWYNLQIPLLAKERTIINATEGGAKLEGAVQMSLQEAVEKYCTKEYDLKEIMEQVPPIWETWEEKAQVYRKIQEQYRFFRRFYDQVKEGIQETKRAEVLLKRKNYDLKDLQKIDKKLDRVTKQVTEKDGMVLLVRRIIDVDVTLNDDLLKEEEDLDKESIRLYGKLRRYYQGLQEALEELFPVWEEMQRELNEEYQFEPNR